MNRKKIPGDKLVLILSFGLLIVSLIGFNQAYKKMKITDRGETIVVNIKEAPEDCSKVNSRRKSYCKLEYNNKIYVKKVGRRFCSLVSGKEKVEMLTNQERNYIIFKGEYDSSEYGSGVFLLLVTLFAIYRTIKSIRLKDDDLDY